MFRRRERERKRERTRRAKKNATTTTPMVFLFSGSYNCKARVNSKNEIEGFRNQHRHSKRQSRSIEDRWCCCCCWEKGRRGELSEGNRGWSRFFFPQLFSWKKKRGKRFFPFASGTRICKQCRVLKVVESSQYSKWRIVWQRSPGAMRSNGTKDALRFGCLVIFLTFFNLFWRLSKKDYLARASANS